MDVATFALTTSLVLVTGYYAWQARQTVAEMREDRRQSQLPALRLDLWVLAKDHVVVRLRNVGSGTAHNVDVDLEFVPPPRSAAQRSETRSWRSPVLYPGEHLSFHFPDVERKSPDLTKIVET